MKTRIPEARSSVVRLGFLRLCCEARIPDALFHRPGSGARFRSSGFLNILTTQSAPFPGMPSACDAFIFLSTVILGTGGNLESSDSSIDVQVDLSISILGAAHRLDERVE